ncbi:MAG: hypothetical protein AAFY98_11910 [Verrucomicrobiota bacterium]
MSNTDSRHAVRNRLRADRPSNLPSLSSQTDEEAVVTTFPRNPTSKPSWTGGSGRINSKDIIAVLLDSLEIKTENFLSRDLTKEREGLVTITVAGEMTEMGFRDTDEGVEIKKRSVLYVGRNPARLPFSINVMESDKETRDLINDTTELLQKAGNSPAAAFHPAVSPGIKLVSGILGIIKSKIEDDQEYQFFATYDEPFKNNSKLLIKGQNSAGREVISLKLRIVNLGGISIKHDLSIRIKDIKVEWDLDKVIAEKNTSRRRWVAREISRGNPMTTKRYIKDFGLKWFSIEATSKKTTFGYSAKIDDTRDSLDLYEIELALAKAGTGTKLAGRHFVPLSLSLALSPKDIKPEAILGLLPDAFDLAKAFGTDTSEVEKVVGKAQPHVTRLLQDLSPKAIPLYRFEGIVFLDPVDTGNSGNLPSWVSQFPDGLISMTYSNTDQAWTYSIQSSIKIDKKSVGTLTATLGGVNS